MRLDAGSRMTASFGVKPWHVGTSTGRAPTPACTTRHSREGQGLYLGARFACRTTTPPKNPNRSWIEWFPDPSNWHAQPGNLTARPQAAPPQQEICRRYNEGRCRQLRCKYTHACRDCGAPHPWVSCPRNTSRAQGRSRSPLRPPPHAFYGQPSTQS